MALLGPHIVRKLYGIYDGLTEIDVIAIESVHHEAVEGEEVHPPAMIDYPGTRNLHEPQELVPPELDPV
jgi:hypothetical protein